jgi:hypothetical protein
VLSYVNIQHPLLNKVKTFLVPLKVAIFLSAAGLTFLDEEFYCMGLDSVVFCDVT